VSENIQPTPELNAAALYEIAEQFVQRPEAESIDYPLGRSTEHMHTRVIAAQWKNEAGSSNTLIHAHATQYAPLSSRYHPETHIVVGTLTPFTSSMAAYMGARVIRDINGTIKGESWYAVVGNDFVAHWQRSGGSHITLPHIPFSPGDDFRQAFSDMIATGAMTIDQEATENAANYFRTAGGVHPEGTEMPYPSRWRALGGRILRFLGIR
jgi:hypothetical protein